MYSEGLRRGKMGLSLWLNDGHFLFKKDGESSVKLWQGGLSSKAIVETCLGWFKGELAGFGNDIFEVSLKKNRHENYIKCLKEKEHHLPNRIHVWYIYTYI